MKKASDALALQMLSNALILSDAKDPHPLTVALRKLASVTTASNVRFLAPLGMTPLEDYCRYFAHSYRG